MKVGILGTGMIVKDLLTVIDKIPFESVYLLGTDATREETEGLKEQYHLDRTYYNYDELLKSDCDTIYVALPNHLHYPFAKKALLAGKNAIVEKPGTSNSREMKELRDLAEENHLIFLEAMYIPFMRAFKLLQENLKKIGTLKIVSLNYSQYSSRYDKFKEGIVLPAFDPKKSGGALMDLNVYNVNFVINLFGKPEKVDYLANIARGIDTSGILCLDYSDFKISAIAAKDCKAPVTCTLQGDKGCIVIEKPVNFMTEFKVEMNDGTVETVSDPEPMHRLRYEWDAFIPMIDNKDFAAAEKALNNSIAVSETLEAARKSAGIVFPADKE